MRLAGGETGALKAFIMSVYIPLLSPIGSALATVV